MSTINTISPDKLSRLVGTPRCPALIDVRPEDEFDASPLLIPGSIRRDHAETSEWGSKFTGRSAVVICKNGTQLSQGTAAWLRHEGVAADALEHGFDAWKKAALPLLSIKKMPPLDRHGRTVWVTRARPKIDRIACPWLIRRFVDPNAVFLFVASAECRRCRRTLYGAEPFDLEGVFWSHRGDRCTFDLMVEEFGLKTEPLLASRYHRTRGRHQSAGARARRWPGCWQRRSVCRACTPTTSPSWRPGLVSTMHSTGGAATRSTKRTRGIQRNLRLRWLGRMWLKGGRQ